MKIVIDARFLGTETGIGRYIKEIVENLEQIDENNQYVIFLRKENWDKYYPKKQNFIKRCVDVSWYSLREQFSLPRYIKKESPDICFFPHFNVPVFCNVPYVVMIHDLILRHFPSKRASTLGPIKFYFKYFFYNFILRRALRGAKKIITPTYFVRNDIISEFKIDPDKIRVINEGLSCLPEDTSLSKEHLKTKGILSPYILYVGNAYPHKNLERFTEAFLELKKEKRDIQLVLVGRRDYFSKRLEQELGKKESFKIRYPKDIIFYGFARDQELALLYKNAKLYAFPTLMEGFGLPPLEALSFGVPVVCSDIPVLHEVLGGAVIYFDPNNKEDIKNKLKDCLASDVKLIGKSDTMLNRYNWRVTAEETLEVFSGR